MLIAAPDNGSPRGTLNVDKDIVRVGTNAQLDWQVIYPSNVHNMVDVKTPGRVVPKQPVNMKVRVLGVAFQAGSNQLPVDAYMSLNGSSWSQFFYGRSADVNPEQVVVNMHAQQGDTLDFGARGWNDLWLPFHSTQTEDPYVTVLSNGNSAPNYDQGTITNFLKPYVDASGKVRIGPRDLIVLWECSTAAPGTAAFDMQDLAILITFE